MTSLRILFSRLIAVLRKGRLEDELDAEIRNHIDMETDENLRRSMSAMEARQAAVRKFGGIDRTKEHYRELRGIPLIESVLQDLRLACRSLLSNKRFTVFGLLTIVMTIGGITTVFTLVDSVLLNPLPYPDSDRLVTLRQSQETDSPGVRMVSFMDAEDFRNRMSSIERIALYRQSARIVDAPESPFRVRVWSVAPDMFPLLGIRTVLGRGLLPTDAQPDSPTVGVIDYDYWQVRYGGSPDVLGKKVRLPDAEPAAIVGVVSRGFQMPRGPDPVSSVWISLKPSSSDLNRQNRNLLAIASLRKGTSLEAANSELAAIAEQLEGEHEDTNRGRRAEMTRLMTDVVGGVSRTLWIFMGAVACLLLIGLGNLVSLQVVRTTGRERELGIRAALGASRGRIIRQLVVETLMLSIAGGLLGIAAAWGGIRIVLLALPAQFPRADQIGLNPTVFAFALLTATLVGIVAGLAPALRATHSDLGRRINEGSRGTAMNQRRARLQRSLIAIETGLALVLLIGAGLLTKSFYRLVTVDAGMNEERLWSANISLPLAYTPPVTNNLLKNTLISIRSLPEVEAAAILTTPPPLSGLESYGGVRIDRNGVRQEVLINLSLISGDFFKTLGVSMIKGRTIEDSDVLGAERVMVVSESLAKVIWPGQDPIGRTDFGNTRVVGVAADFKKGRLNEDPFPTVYQSYLQNTLVPSPTFMVRVKPGVRNIPTVLRSLIAGIEPDARVQIAAMDEVRWRSLGIERFRTAILTVFAGAAMFLAILGVWGVVSYSVVQRTREIGLRMALGATLGNVTRLMIHEAIMPAGIGFAVGLGVAIVMMRLLQSFLFQVGAIDVPTYVFATAILALATLVASVLPARRATRIDPVRALRLD